MAVAVAPSLDADQRYIPHVKTNPAKPLVPKASDKVPDQMCLHCGLTGDHRNAHSCIDALRSYIAEQEPKTGAKWGRKKRGGSGWMKFAHRNPLAVFPLL